MNQWYCTQLKFSLMTTDGFTHWWLAYHRASAICWNTHLLRAKTVSHYSTWQPCWLSPEGVTFMNESLSLSSLFWLCWLGWPFFVPPLGMTCVTLGVVLTSAAGVTSKDPGSNLSCSSVQYFGGAWPDMDLWRSSWRVGRGLGTLVIIISQPRKLTTNCQKWSHTVQLLQDGDEEIKLLLVLMTSSPLKAKNEGGKK